MIDLWINNYYDKLDNYLRINIPGFEFPMLFIDIQQEQHRPEYGSLWDPGWDWIR